MYLCIVITYSRVANPACGQLNWENGYVSLSPFTAENLVSRDGFGRPVPRQPAHSPHSGLIWCLLTRLLPISAASFMYLCRHPPSGHTAVRHRGIPPSAIGSIPSLSGHKLAYRWRSRQRVRRHRASSSPQGSSSHGCCFFRFHHGSINVRLSFRTPIMGMKANGSHHGDSPLVKPTGILIASKTFATSNQPRRICMESTSYVLSFRMVFFLPCDHGLDF